MKINLHNYLEESIINGPGCRAVVWVQGCDIGCPSCFNKDTWAFEERTLIEPAELAERILSNPRHEGATFSGGEPFRQAEALAEVARIIKKKGLNVMSFSGFTYDYLKKGLIPGALELLAELDILVDGPYLENQVEKDLHPLVSSRNQRVRVFNKTLEADLNWRSTQVEFRIGVDGTVSKTGYVKV